MNQSEDKQRLRRIEKIKAKLREKINVTKDLKNAQTYKYMTRNFPVLRKQIPMGLRFSFRDILNGLAKNYPRKAV